MQSNVLLAVSTERPMAMRIAAWILTTAFLIVFLYFGIDKFLNPILWIGFLPLWMDGFMGMSSDIWIKIIGAIEIILAMMLIVPISLVRRVGAAFIALHLAGVIMQVGWNDIAARDLGLLLAAAALFFLIPRGKKSS